MEKPGLRISEDTWASVNSRVSRNQTHCNRALPHRLQVDSCSVVGHFDQHIRSGVARGKTDRRHRLLAGGQPKLRWLDAVVHAVADQVHQRVVQLVDHRLVEFGVAAIDGQLDLLMKIAGQVMHQPPEALEGPADGQHADAHRVLAQRRSQPFDLLGDRDHVRIFSAGRNLPEPRLHRYQLPHQVDKLVELRRGNADARSHRPGHLRGARTCAQVHPAA